MAQLPYIRSLLDFQRAFPDEASCLDYLEKVRWPKGFVCPKCGVHERPFLITTRPRILVCRSCRAETSLTAGTVLESTHMPLQVWFWAAYLMTSATPGISAVQFKRQLGLSRYETAYQMLQKLRAGMVRPHRDKIGARHPVEVDEAYVGGKTKGEGRGKTRKVVVAGAVEVRQGEKEDPATGEVRIRRYAGRLRLRKVPSRGKKSLLKFVADNVERGATVVTDEWAVYGDLPREGYDHKPATIQAPEDIDQEMPMIHLVFSNLKSWLLGTHHGVSPKHLQAYLNEYVFRFNRRFHPFAGFHSLLGIATKAKGPEYAELYSGAWEHPNPPEVWL